MTSSDVGNLQRQCSYICLDGFHAQQAHFKQVETRSGGCGGKVADGIKLAFLLGTVIHTLARPISKPIPRCTDWGQTQVLVLVRSAIAMLNLVFSP
eukprot:SAG31_NODE_1887_length_6988_cov_2.417332_3_plen_96_part_00